MRVEAAASDDLQTRADLACAHAVVALDARDAATALVRAYEALTGLREVAKTLKAEQGSADEAVSEDAAARRGDFDDDVASALRINGDALLALERYRKRPRGIGTLCGTCAAAGPRCRGAAGQLLHQIGNCESHLGNHEFAARQYVQAAQIFATVGLREFLGKAMGELGYVLLD